MGRKRRSNSDKCGDEDVSKKMRGDQQQLRSKRSRPVTKSRSLEQSADSEVILGNESKKNKMPLITKDHQVGNREGVNNKKSKKSKAIEENHTQNPGNGSFENNQKDVSEENKSHYFNEVDLLMAMNKKNTKKTKQTSNKDSSQGAGSLREDRKVEENHQEDKGKKGRKRTTNKNSLSVNQVHNEIKTEGQEVDRKVKSQTIEEDATEVGVDYDDQVGVMSDSDSDFEPDVKVLRLSQSGNDSKSKKEHKGKKGSARKHSKGSGVEKNTGKISENCSNGVTELKISKQSNVCKDDEGVKAKGKNKKSESVKARSKVTFKSEGQVKVKAEEESMTTASVSALPLSVDHQDVMAVLLHMEGTGVAGQGHEVKPGSSGVKSVDNHGDDIDEEEMDSDVSEEEADWEDVEGSLPFDVIDGLSYWRFLELLWNTRLIQVNVGLSVKE